MLEDSFKNAESPEFAGKAVVALAGDKNKMAKSGKILLTSDLALEYGFTDSGGYLFLIYSYFFIQKIKFRNIKAVNLKADHISKL